MFNNRFRGSEESVATFVSELRSLAEHCSLGATLPDMLRDRLVCGIINPTLSEPELTFAKAQEITLAMEAATCHIMELHTQKAGAAPIQKYFQEQGRCELRCNI